MTCAIHRKKVSYTYCHQNVLHSAGDSLSVSSVFSTSNLQFITMSQHLQKVERHIFFQQLIFMLIFTVSLPNCCSNIITSEIEHFTQWGQWEGRCIQTHSLNSLGRIVYNATYKPFLHPRYETFSTQSKPNI